MTANDGKFTTITISYVSPDGHDYSRQYGVDLLTHQVLWKNCYFNNNFELELKSEQNEIDGEMKITKFDDLVIDYKPPFILPVMIRCQNCETNYPTKYQYQRHQCEFNADKIVLKPETVPTTPVGGGGGDDGGKHNKTKYDCSVCNKQFVSRNNLERHQECHTDPNDNICEYCNKRFVSQNRLKIHKENHCKKAGDLSKFYRSDVIVWKCGKCHQVFSSNQIANYHYESCQEHLLTNHDEEKIERISTELLLQCEFCNCTFADKSILLEHQKQHSTERNYECVLCTETFDSYITATQHWLKKCSDTINMFHLPKLVYCQYCDRTFKSHELLYTHKIKKKHYTQKSYCNSSGNGISSSRQPLKNEDTINKLIEDVLIALEIPLNKKNDDQNILEIVEIKNEPQDANNNTNNKDEKLVEKKRRGRKRKLTKSLSRNQTINLEDGFVYQCERCIKIFTNITDLEMHHEQEHATTFNCDECSQVLHSARALLVHSRAHKNLKPFICDICGKSYSQTSHLWQHMRFHQGIKPFACPHEGCEARYTIRPDLKDHIRKVHTRERPFKCNVCGKCFLTGSVYYQHRLIHTGDRRYGCDICERRFFRADALNNHKRIHTNERPYPCCVCGRLFRQKGDCNKHCRTQHPDAIFK